MIEILNVILIVFIFVCAVAAVVVSELVSATFLLSCYSFFLAILWSVLAAPDVSFTEAMVGVGASTIFILLALFRTKHVAAKPVFGYQTALAAVFIICLGVLLFWGSTNLSWFGNPHSAPNAYLSPFYLEHAYHDTLTPNVVTTVLADYRAFDTLIETTVIFTAGIACLLIMKDKI